MLKKNKKERKEILKHRSNIECFYIYIIECRIYALRVTPDKKNTNPITIFQHFDNKNDVNFFVTKFLLL